MLIIEETDRWSRLVRCLLQGQSACESIRPSELNVGEMENPKLVQHQLIALEYGQECLNSWIRLFDKNAPAIENLDVVLVGAPTEPQQLARCWELGFIFCIPDVESLTRFLTARNLTTRCQTREDQEGIKDLAGDKRKTVSGFRQEMLQKLPWPATRTSH